MRLPARSPARRDGMSLIEVLVALAIFIMAFAALGQLVQLGMDQAVEADQRSVATRLAQAKLAEVEAGAIGIDGGDQDFTEEELLTDGSPQWHWQAAGTPTEIPNLYEVTVTVSTKAGPPFTHTLTQMVFDPTSQATAAPTTDPNAASSTTQGNDP